MYKRLFCLVRLSKCLPCSFFLPLPRHKLKKVQITIRLFVSLDFDVRLVNGSNSYSGRVEIKYAGAWGTVSDVNWDIRDGHVVCKQLGFKGAVGVYTQARYGQGRGPIWISNANCNGNETKFADCLPPSWENTISAFSSHARDASVVCNNGVNEPSKLNVGKFYISLTFFQSCLQFWFCVYNYIGELLLYPELFSFPLWFSSNSML